MRRKIRSNSHVVTAALDLGKPAEGKECGKAHKIGKTRRPLMDIEMDLIKIKKQSAIIKIERDAE